MFVHTPNGMSTQRNPRRSGWQGTPALADPLGRVDDEGAVS